MVDSFYFPEEFMEIPFVFGYQPDNFVENKPNCRTIVLANTKPESVKIAVKGRLVVVEATEKIEKSWGNSKTIRLSEIRHEFTLPEGVDSEKITSNFCDGKLKIEWPVEASIEEGNVNSPLKGKKDLEIGSAWPYI